MVDPHGAASLISNAELPAHGNHDASRCPQCQEPVAPTQPGAKLLRYCQYCRLPLVEVAEKYRIERKIGDGGGGVVYLARHMHLQLNPYRVVKFLHNEQLQSPTGLKRFAREIEVTAALSQNNEHIVRIYDDFGHLPQLGHFYVMEFLEGHTLGDKMAQHTKGLPLNETIHIFSQLCQAVHAIHQADIIHRDLKPQNIYLIQRDHDHNFVKVMDFGIAKMVANPGLTQTKESSIGTPLYMSPEQCMGLPADERSDIYAMGILLYELLTGHAPFLQTATGTTTSLLEIAAAHLYHEPIPFQEHSPNHGIPHAIEEAVMQALSKPREDRFQSALAFQRAVEIAAGKSDAQVATFTTPTTSPSPPSAMDLEAMDFFSGEELESVSRQTPIPPPSSPYHPAHPSASPSMSAKNHKHTEQQRRPQLVAGLLFLLGPLAIGIVLLAIWLTQPPAQQPPPQRLAKQPKQPNPRLIGLPLSPRPTSVAPERSVPDAAAPLRPVRRRPHRVRRRPRSRPHRQRVFIARRRLVARTPGCSPDPPNGRWIRIRIKPAQARFHTKGRLQHRSGGVCVLQSKKGSLRVRITHYNYQPCFIKRRFTKRIYTLTLKPNKSQHLDDSLDYCLKK